VSVVGNSGSGKTTLGRRLAALLDVPFVELDATHHLPGWQPIDPDEFTARVTERVAGEGWVIDGNYRAVVLDGPVWKHADTIVWLDLPRRTVMRQVVWRTLRRTATREELWNGNRELLRNLWRWDPRENIIRWAWTRHATVVTRYEAAIADPSHRHLTFIRLRTSAEADRWLASLGPVADDGSILGQPL